MMQNRDRYTALQIEIADGVATLTMPRSREDAVVRGRLHTEMTTVWRDMLDDPDIRAVLVTGTGDEFYGSGTPRAETMRILAEDPPEAVWKLVTHFERELNAIINEMVAFEKPVVAAVNGVASGAGLAIALLADITVVHPGTRMLDPHIMLGLNAGDHAPMLWPLSIGMPKSKLYMMTSDELDGAEAERIGLVGRCVPHEDLLTVAGDYARRFATGPAVALRFTKKSLNQWFKLGGLVAHDYSFALEALSFFSPEARAVYPNAAKEPGETST